MITPVNWYMCVEQRPVIQHNYTRYKPTKLVHKLTMNHKSNQPVYVVPRYILSSYF